MLESYVNISFLLSGELYASESFLNFTHRLQWMSAVRQMECNWMGAQ